MAITDTAIYVPPAWYGDTYGDNGRPPAKGSVWTCPTFGETAKRITDTETDVKEAYTAEYSSSGLFNCDNTYIRILETASNSLVFDLSDLSLVRTLAGSASPSDYWWHPTNPVIIYNLDAWAGQLKSTNVDTGATAVVKDFTNAPTSYGVPIVGTGESNLSYQNGVRRLGLTANHANDQILFCYDFEEDEVVAELDFSGIGGYFDGSVSAKGDKFITAINEGGNLNFWIYDMNVPEPFVSTPGVAALRDIGGGTARFKFNVDHPDGDYKGSGHNDKCLGPDGVDYIFGSESNFTNHYFRFDIDAGTREPFIPMGWHAPSGPEEHWCCNSTQTDGWVYFSLQGKVDVDPENPGSNWRNFWGEVVRLRYDADGTTLASANAQRLIHHRTSVDTPGCTAGEEYYMNSKISVSTDGRHGVFNSNHRFQEQAGEGANPVNDVFLMQLAPTDGTYRLRLG